ncbi:MAG: PTS transporter subunit IIC [Pelolinea sp.]|nr:PTS transporter subunit IIC [Pelolinea sp.]
MQAVMGVIQYILDLGPTVMMPIIVFALSMVFGIKANKAFRAAITIGIGFIAINLVVGLMVNALAPATNAMVANLGVEMDIMDVGWPIGAAIAFGTSQVVPWIFVLGILMNVVMLAKNWTQTANIDMWNYWHFIFVAGFVNVALRDALGQTTAMVVAIGVSLVGAAMTLKLADWTAPIVQKFFELPGVSLPHMETVTWAPVGYAVNWLVDRIPVVKDWHADPDTIKEKFGVLGETMIVGTILGLIIALLAFAPGLGTDFGGNLAKILNTSISLGAVMMVLPRMVSILMEGLMPLSEGAREFITKKFPGRKIHIGLDAAIAIGHPANVATGLLMVPIALALAVAMNAIGLNRMLPFADLAILPFYAIWAVGWSKGNIIRGVINGTVFLGGMLYIATKLALYLTTMGAEVGFQMPEGAALISSIDVGAHLNGYMLALPFIRFIEGGWGAFALTAAIVIAIFAAVAVMMKKSDVEAIVADIDDF